MEPDFSRAPDTIESTIHSAQHLKRLGETMSWQDWVAKFLVEERARKLESVKLLRAGAIGTHEMRDGRQVDTTEETVANQQAQITELEKILGQAGIPF